MNEFASQENPMNNNTSSGTTPPPSPSPTDELAERLKKCYSQYEQEKKKAEELAQRGDVPSEVIDQLNRNASEQLAECVRKANQASASESASASAGADTKQSSQQGAQQGSWSSGGAAGAGAGASAGSSQQPKRPVSPHAKLYRSEHDRFLAGVCGGIGEYLKIDSSFVRIAVILLSFIPAPLPIIPGIVVYAALAIILPMKTESGEFKRMF